jgi:hypothetical protein
MDRCHRLHVNRRASLATLALFLGCTRGDLQAIDDVNINLVDNLLQIKGTVCTDPPEPTNFPVKILFIIDGSGSMQFIDNPTRRALAVEEVILRLRANPAVSFAIIRFNEADAVLTRPSLGDGDSNPCHEDCVCNCDANGDGACNNMDFTGIPPDPDCNGRTINTGDDPASEDLLDQAFTRDPGLLQSAVQGLRVADSVTDYQGALATAYKVLFDDMYHLSAAERARTKYVTLFLSDGDPFPDCCGMNSTMCDPSTNLPFCSDPELIRVNPTQLPFLAANEDYNQPYQIYSQLRDIMELQEIFQVGDLRFHTAFLFDPALVTALQPDGTYVIAGVVFVNVPEATMLLTEMATIGKGVFRDFSKAEDIDFLGFDLTNLKLENAMKNFTVTNANLIPTDKGLATDSDGDGLTDAEEFEAGLNRLLRDSDNDGYSDRFELARQRNGMDPLMITPGCETEDDRDDSGDLDGLLPCEERLLRSDDQLYDTDADGVPDGLEVLNGTNPTISDALSDADRDGVRNGDEIRAHTGVSFDEVSRRPDLAYRYKTDELGLNDAGGRCYSFDVKNVQLGTPLERPGEPASFGRNDLLVYMAEAPREDPDDFGAYKVACVRARYIAPDFKDPAEGIIELSPENFVDSGDLDLDRDCVGQRR